MTEHLPECYDLWQTPSNCVLCDALRACEDRITAAAVQRVEALIAPWPNTWTGGIRRGNVFAAIKGDQP
jgi:hypothetical protein